MFISIAWCHFLHANVMPPFILLIINVTCAIYLLKHSLVCQFLRTGMGLHILVKSHQPGIKLLNAIQAYWLPSHIQWEYLPMAETMGLF